MAEPSVDGEYVEGSLVVGDEDVGCVFANVLVSGDGYGDEVEPAEEACPYDLRVVAPPACATERAAYYCDDSGQGGDDEHYGHHYENLVYAIEKHFDFWVFRGAIYFEGNRFFSRYFDLSRIKSNYIDLSQAGGSCS